MTTHIKEALHENLPQPLGFVLIFAGIGGMAFSFVSNAMGSVSGIVDLAVNHQTAARKACNANEHLQVEQGPEEYDPVNQTYGRPTQYYCVNAAGVRRDVTGAFVNNLFGQIGGIFSGGGLQLPWLALSGFGFVLIVLGLLIRRRRPDTPVGVQSYPSLAGSPDAPSTSFSFPAGGSAQTFTVPSGSGQPRTVTVEFEHARSNRHPRQQRGRQQRSGAVAGTGESRARTDGRQCEHEQHPERERSGRQAAPARTSATTT